MSNEQLVHTGTAIGWYRCDGDNCPICSPLVVPDKPETMSDASKPRPKIVCLCGSGRFMDAFNEAEFQETLAGNIVLTIGCNTKDIARSASLSQYKPMLDELHKRKIDLADEVFVLNVGGYIGSSTRSEIEYAEAHGKPVRYLE